MGGCCGRSTAPLCGPFRRPRCFGPTLCGAALDVDDSVLAAATDDASLVEAAGGAIAVVEAPRENIKVTTALDLRVAEAMLEARC